MTKVIIKIYENVFAFMVAQVVQKSVFIFGGFCTFSEIFIFRDIFILREIFIFRYSFVFSGIFIFK